MDCFAMKKSSVLVLVFLMYFGSIVCAVEPYPMKIEYVHKSEAKYNTPENAFMSRISSLVKKDHNWYHDTLTLESSRTIVEKFNTFNIDPNRKFDSVKGISKGYILKKETYMEGVLLICKFYNENGSVDRGPSILVQENGLWKTTHEYADDQNLWGYFSTFPKLFDGQTRLPAGANTFLAYANPLELRTEVQVNTFPLHVFYGETIDPVAFKAKFNNVDITSRFTPQPVGDEVVVLDLQQGKNTLVMSIEGTRESGRRSTDRDTLLLFYRPK